MWFLTIGIIIHINCCLTQEVQGIGKQRLTNKKSQFHEKLEAFLLFSASYSLSFQKDGFMNDDSVNVWAKSQFDFPELTTFTICTWVKFTYEVRNEH